MQLQNKANVIPWLHSWCKQSLRPLTSTLPALICCGVCGALFFVEIGQHRRMIFIAFQGIEKAMECWPKLKQCSSLWWTSLNCMPAAWHDAVCWHIWKQHVAENLVVCSFCGYKDMSKCKIEILCIQLYISSSQNLGFIFKNVPIPSHWPPHCFQGTRPQKNWICMWVMFIPDDSILKQHQINTKRKSDNMSWCGLSFQSVKWIWRISFVNIENRIVSQQKDWMHLGKQVHLLQTWCEINPSAVLFFPVHSVLV